MSYEVIIDLSDVEHRSFDFKRMFDESIPCKERIVRCRDCKYRYGCLHLLDDGDDDMRRCNATPEGYCGWGRKATWA